MEEFSKIEVQNPLLEIVASITSKHTGVSLEDMKSSKRAHHVIVARTIFANACRTVVFPQYYIPYFLNRTDSILKYWYDQYDINYEMDVAFAMLADKVKKELNDKLKSLKDV